MIFMKRIFSFALVLVMIACLISCDGTAKPYDPLTYRFDYDLSEYIDLAEYKGLPAQGFEFKVTEEEIKNYINATLTAYSQTVEVTDRGAQLGDTVYIDFIGTVDGSEFKGSSATDYPLSLGFSSFVEGFEDGITGLKAGDSVSLDLKFPETYETNPQVAGKDVHYEVTVKKITTLILPEYNDEFAKKHLNCESTEQYEQGIREMFKVRYKAYFYKEVLGQIWDTIIDNTEVIKFPKKDLKQAYDAYIEHVETYSEHNNMTVADYASIYYGKTTEEFYEYAHVLVEEQMKEDMICYAIARAENIVLTDEEYLVRAEEYAIDYYMMESVEAFEEMYGVETVREMILFDLVREKVCDYADMTYIN